MLENLSAEPVSVRRGWINPLAYAARWAVGRLLSWRPQGSILIVLPSGECMRFGPVGNGAEPVLRLRRHRVFYRIMRRGAIGFAEAYMDGDIDCSDLTGLFRFLLRNQADLERSGRLMLASRLKDRVAHWTRRNSKRGSRRNITEHYDLGNDFYRLWLDPSMLYSSGYYAEDVATLEKAQAAKLQKIIDLLQLSDSEKILEIGCGWGAFALEVARQHGASVEGVTLSHEQLDHARNAATDVGLADKCTFRLEDYRDMDGSYDRIVSIEMIEAVGETYWPQYFRVLNERLKPGGAAVVQAITIDESRFENYRRSADFIQRYVFPGGMLPTPTMIEYQAEKAGLQLDHVEHFGRSYAETLLEWSRRFEAAWPEIAQLGFDEHFRRRWRYYLAYCEAGFREGSIDVGVYRLRKA
ncbi:Cyclopropane-fatty-acyl-phospholipid synthase [Roseibium album]|nr:Cyclopropane-fatty-acyl-phospholipid synthase [Roseibium album]